jgi:hypothetical protein
MAIATIEHAVPKRKKLLARSSSPFISLFTKLSKLSSPEQDCSQTTTG